MINNYFIDHVNNIEIVITNRYIGNKDYWMMTTLTAISCTGITITLSH